MTVTSNDTGQINQALMDLQRHKGGVSVGREQTIEDVYHPESDQEVRFYMNDSINDFNSYILLGDLIVLFGRYTLNKTNGFWKNTYVADYGTYYQYIRYFNLTIPYPIEPAGALVQSQIQSHTESGRNYLSLPSYYYSSIYGLPPGHGLNTLTIPNDHQLLFASSSLYDGNDINSVQFTEVVNYFIFTKIK